ncbi:MAG: hypothetical protein WCA46_23510 [Actinocatenispora sp.]
MPDTHGVLVRYRPTWQQAAGRGLLAGVLLALVAAIGELLRLVRHGMRWSDLALVPAAFLLGSVISALIGRRAGVQALDSGLRAAPGMPSRRFVPWSQIVDVRTERRRNHTVVTCYLSTGGRWRLPAPYDGGALGRDPEFEEKMFTIRNLWESYRIFAPEPLTREGPLSPGSAPSPDPH